jgi:hypothetical protein
MLQLLLCLFVHTHVFDDLVHLDSEISVSSAAMNSKYFVDLLQQYTCKAIRSSNPGAVFPLALLIQADFRHGWRIITHLTLKKVYPHASAIRPSLDD